LTKPCNVLYYISNKGAPWFRQGRREGQVQVGKIQPWKFKIL